MCNWSNCTGLARCDCCPVCWLGWMWGSGTGSLLQLWLCMFSLCNLKPSQTLEHTELQRIRRETQMHLQDPLPHPHQETQRGTLAKPTFSDVIIGEPWEPTRAIYLDHMDLTIVRRTANMAAGLSLVNEELAQLAVLDGSTFDYFPVFQTSGWFCVTAHDRKKTERIWNDFFSPKKGVFQIADWLRMFLNEWDYCSY